MSITELEQRCNALRNDLKAWEKQFAAQHNGKKAGRDDIKADAIISQKYKEYTKLRTQSSTTKEAPQTPSKRTTSRKQAADVERTPRAPPKAPVLTPLKRKREDELAAEEIDAASEFLSPQGPAFIGPTPQRDGIVLGLFDNLNAETPSKRRIIFGEIEPNVFQTPSKNTEAASEASLESRARGERTPLSAGKRFLFNQFVTPKKRSLDEEGTPTSAARGLATPAFLRRDNVLDRIEEADETTPRPAPWKRRGLGRSLSAMIQAMRKDEDDRLDEEADIMRELEMEEEGILAPARPRASQILVEDSQVTMPLGPDRGSESEEEEEEEEQLGRDGKPRKVWKKKGLKRQTRRVIMRPNAVKPKAAPEFQHNDEDSDVEQTSVPETQAQADAEPALSDDEDDSDYASDVSHSAKKRKPPVKKVDNPDEKKEGVVKKVTRKISATAHANYQRLKIKGKGPSNGKPRGRFGRR